MTRAADLLLRSIHCSFRPCAPVQGFVPSAVFMAVCWAFLMLEALLLAEVNVSLMREQRKNEGERGRDGGSLEVISFRTMAEETLGGWGAHAATVAYVFLAYTSTTAYAAKAGELLSRLVGLPTSVSGALFTLFHAAIIVIGGASTTDRVNQWMTTSMLGPSLPSPPPVGGILLINRSWFRRVPND